MTIGAAAELAHRAAGDLRGEELVLEVERDRAVPVLFADLVDVFALVVGRVVDEDRDRPEALADLLHRRLERGDVGQVALEEERRGSGSAELRRERLGRLDLDVDEGDVRPLPDEGFDDRRADARSAAGDEDDFVEQRRIAGMGMAVSG